ncbi:MAG: hypothetical protein WKF47_09355 [Geodermatophilaceae bacterium]
MSAEQDHWADTADPIRARVLASWAASPARFREDANAEEDLALGGYRDRLLVELAQNAADAAVRAGQPGRLSLRLVDGVLSAANTGAPLDGAGVQALATLRASAKRDGATVGRFGVGFAAVLAVSDAPRVVSATGGVEFSAERTRALVAELPELAEELARRGGAVPVLRLPFGVGGGVPPGFDTEVRLPLRPGVQGCGTPWPRGVDRRGAAVPARPGRDRRRRAAAVPHRACPTETSSCATASGYAGGGWSAPRAAHRPSCWPADRSRSGSARPGRSAGRCRSTMTGWCR